MLAIVEGVALGPFVSVSFVGHVSVVPVELLSSFSIAVSMVVKRNRNLFASRSDGSEKLFLNCLVRQVFVNLVDEYQEVKRQRCA